MSTATASAATPAADCGCTTTGSYVAPASGVAPSVSASGSSPHGKYAVTASAGTPGGLANVTVKRVSDGAVLLTTQATVWGFSPDDDRFVTQQLQSTGSGAVHDLSLYNLSSTTPQTPEWHSAVAASTDRVQFSPSGRFLFYADQFGTQTQLQLLNARTGTGRYQDAFTTVSAPGDDSFGVAGWGFGPNDERFVFAYATGQTTAQWQLVNLAKAKAVQSVSLATAQASWSFSPCGDVVGLVYQAPSGSTTVDVFKTGSGALAGSLSTTAAVSAVQLKSTSSSQVATISSVDQVLSANTAPTTCYTGGLQAAFVAPSAPAAGVAVAFTDTSTDTKGTITSWSWGFGDGATSAAQNPSHTFAAAGNYTVALTVKDGAGRRSTSSSTVTVGAGPAEQASFVYSPDPVTRGSQVTFTDTSAGSGGLASEQWDINGTTYNGPTVTVHACGPLDVTLSVLDQAGNSATTSKVISVPSTAQVVPVPAGASLAAAVAAACPGDTLQLAAGSYTGGVRLDAVNLEGAGEGLSVVTGVDPVGLTDGWVLETGGSSAVTVSDLTVTGGLGGVHAMTAAQTTLSRLEVTGNTEYGGINVGSGGAAVIDGSFVHANHNVGYQDGGGGISEYCCGTLTISNSEIAGNTSDGNGGGADLQESALVTFTHNNVHDNTAAREGGGLFLGQGFGTSPELVLDNRFVSNTATDGGGLAVGNTGDDTLAAGNLVAHNTGGGLVYDGGTTNVVNDTIVDNAGTGLYLSPTYGNLLWDKASLANTIVAGNSADLPADAVLCTNTTNLVGTTPAFADSAYHLAPGSAAVDAGSNDAVPAVVATDPDGSARIQDGNGDGTATVDVGYAELPGAGRANVPTGPSLAPGCDPGLRQDLYQSVSAGGSAATDGGAPASAAAPLVTSVSSPAASSVEVDELRYLMGPGSALSQWQDLVSVGAVAPAGTTYQVTFGFDQSLVPAGGSVSVYDNGVLVPSCAAGGTPADPCVTSVTASGSVTSVVVTASNPTGTWTYTSP